MSARFSDTFKKALSNYVTHVLRLFEMVDWRVMLKDEPCEGSDTFASIEVVYGQKYANLRLCHDFFDYSIDKQEHALIHELCHLFSDGIDNVIKNGPEILMGKPGYTVFHENYRVQMELMTDQLAHCFGWLIDGPKHDRLIAAIVAAERDELPLPDPDTAAPGPMA